MFDVSAKQREFEDLKARVRQLEGELADAHLERPWQPSGFYAVYHGASGFVLGIAGAAVALLANVIAAPIAGKNPLELIRVYLTFPMGERALDLTGATNGIGDGMILAFGCCLYLGTGMIIGVPFNILLTRIAGDARLGKRLVVASILAIGIWVVAFYGILSWLQPLLFGGRWILDLVPWWVGAFTHVLYGCTIAVLHPLATFRNKTLPTEKT